MVYYTQLFHGVTLNPLTPAIFSCYLGVLNISNCILFIYIGGGRCSGEIKMVSVIPEDTFEVVQQRKKNINQQHSPFTII